MAKTKHPTSQLRIIGGKWRSRKITFYDFPEIRPTPNRVRETLFNWLAPVIESATCLDAFAGSGALGFEALSRGAKWVVMIDQSKKITEMLKENAAKLEAENLEIFTGNFFDIIADKKLPPFDIIFLDPPFRQSLIKKAAAILINNNLLKNDAYVYMETEKELQPLPIPDDWEIVRNKNAGQVNYYLINVS